MRTMKDIAEQVGVSQAAVSAVLNGSEGSIRVGAATRERILGVAREVGYVRNQVARSVLSGKTRTIGFLTHDVGQEYSARVIDGALAEINETPFALKVMAVGPNSNLDEVLGGMMQHRPEAVIFSSLFQHELDALGRRMQRWSAPVAHVGEWTDSCAFHVMPDNRGGAIEATRHLIELGHRRVAHVTRRANRQYVAERAAGYREAMRQPGIGLAEPDVLELDHLSQDISDPIRDFLSRDDRPTALFCVNDYYALAVGRVALELDLRVPRDLSLIGYDNTLMAGYAYPLLTSATPPYEAMGRETVRRVLEELDGGDAREGAVVLPVFLVHRRSVGPPPRDA